VGEIMTNFLDVLITIFLLFIAIMNLATLDFTKKEIITIIFAILTIGVPVGLFLSYLSIIPIDIAFIFFIYKKQKKIIISILLPLLATIISVVSDYIVSCFNIYVFNININYSYNNIMYLFSFIATVFVILIISRTIRGFIDKKLNTINFEVTKKFSFIIILSLIVTLAIFYINIMLGGKLGFTNEILKLNGIIFFIYCIFFCIIMYVLFKSITKEMEIQNKQAHFESLQKYTENLENLYSEMRVFKHDYVNIISSMIGYMEDNDMQGLKNHFTKNIVPLSNEIGRSKSKIDLLKNIRIPEIKGILSSKLIRAQEIGIDVDIDVAESILKVSMGIIDIVRALGILLDNAIEAAEKCPSPMIKVGFIKKEYSLEVIIINSCLENVPPIYKLNKKGYSTKGENRGVGLSNLRIILDKYDNIFLDTIVENNTFLQKINIEDI
jgi:two-component system sensor histidine kinase AgrC